MLPSCISLQCFVVGYLNRQTDGVKSPSLGAAFVPVSGAKTYKMKELVVEGMDYQRDMIQPLDPETTVAAGMYSYVSKAYADKMAEDGHKAPGYYDNLIGWWDKMKGGAGKAAANISEVDIDVGTAFLGQFLSLGDAKFTFAGTAPQKETSIFTEGKKSPFISCYIPRTIKFKEIVAKNMDYQRDMIQPLNSETTVAAGMYSYVSKEYADKMAEDGHKAPGYYDNLIGWWDKMKGGAGKAAANISEVEVHPGDAFLGQVLSLSDIEFVLPSSIPAAE